MGFSEDDRIRSKNRVHNQAFEEYTKQKLRGSTDSHIADFCRAHLRWDSDKSRHEIYSTILKIVERSSYDEGNS